MPYKNIEDRIAYQKKRSASLAWKADKANRNLITNYGITMEQKKQMIIAQDNRCAICKTEFQLSKPTHVDHDHFSNKVRGILCNCCNVSIGYMKENPLLFEKAADYLRKWGK